MIGADLKWAAGLALLLTTLAPYAQAAPTAQERVLAEALFKEGRALMAEERWDEACPKLEESYKLEALAGVLLNMAVCHEEQGRTATAWSEFKEALALAKIDRRTDRERLATEHIEALEPRLARLRIVVPEPARAPGLTITRDGVALPAAAWGTAVPIDPGQHLVRAEAPRREPYEATVEGVEAKVITVELEPLAALPPVEPPTAPLPAPVVIEPPPPPRRRTPAEPTTVATPWPIVGWSLVGVGVASLAVGTGFGVHAIRQEDAASELCTPTECPDDASLATSDAAQRAALVADVTLIAGGILAASGILVLVLAPSELEVEVSPASAAIRFHF